MTKLIPREKNLITKIDVEIWRAHIEVRSLRKLYNEQEITIYNMKIIYNNKITYRSYYIIVDDGNR
jgi:hypothetical protein